MIFKDAFSTFTTVTTELFSANNSLYFEVTFSYFLQKREDLSVSTAACFDHLNITSESITTFLLQSESVSVCVVCVACVGVLCVCCVCVLCVWVCCVCAVCVLCVCVLCVGVCVCVCVVCGV